jgi:phosphoglycerol transferase MdoB-like AlkP superfamily enzyme
MWFSLSSARRTLRSQLQQKRFLTYSLILFTLIIVPMLLVIGVELIQRGSLHDTLDWAGQHDQLFFLNFVINFFVLLFIYCLLGSLVMAMGVTALLLFIVSLISFFKLKLIGEPFFPWDILLNKEGMNIAPLITGSSSALIKIVIIAVVVSAVFLVRLLLPRLSLPWVSRLVLGLLSIFVLYSFAFKTAWAGKILDSMHVSEIVWKQEQNYSDNGLLLAFTMNVKNSVVAKPEGYNEHAIAAVAKTITDTNTNTNTNAVKPIATDPLNGKKPNVIFIMNEAFWDPTLLPNVTYSEDPVPTIHRLQKESTSGYLLSPQFGGGTSNVEFEVLTGNSMSFLPGGSIPYQQYISKPLPSLASYFEDQGYKSMGIHSYEGWFWDRNTVYKQLGFESFMAKDHFVNPEVKGDFISDADVSRNIIKAVDGTDKPMFIYAVTMQNHGPYDDNRYGTNPIQAQGNLTQDAKSILETYTHGAHDADAALQQLIDHYQKSDEPTIIVFYGDHLPMMGLDYQVYAQSGFVHTGNDSQWSLEELKKMHSVPFVTWSNFAMPKENIPTLSDSFLAGHVLDALHLEKPPQFAMNSALSAKIPGMINNLVVDANQQLHASVPDDAKAEVDEYRNMQYDLMFGKQFLANYLDHDYLTKKSLTNYNQEFAQKNSSGDRQLSEPSTP